MPIDQQHYDNRPGHRVGVVIRSLELFGPRLVYFTINEAAENGWVVRDFIKGRKLTARTSSLEVSTITEKADMSEFPPFHAVTNVEDWKVYLKMRALALLNEAEINKPEPTVEVGN